MPFVPLIQGTLSNFHKISPAFVFILFRGQTERSTRERTRERERERGGEREGEQDRIVDARFQQATRHVVSSPLSLIEHLDANLLLIARRSRRVNQNLTRGKEGGA